MIRPVLVTGCRLPYPTVVIVVIDHQTRVTEIVDIRAGLVPFFLQNCQ